MDVKALQVVWRTLPPVVGVICNVVLVADNRALPVLYASGVVKVIAIKPSPRPIEHFARSQLVLACCPLFSFFVLGSDFNLQESDFSELDPHAVASIFKAYLRERKFLICIYHALHSTHFSLSLFLPPYSPPQEEFTLKRVFFISHYSSPATLDVSINPTVRSGNECRSQRSTSCQTGRFRGP